MKERQAESLTIVIKLHQVPDDDGRVVTSVCVGDVHDVFNIAGKWHHMEIHMHLIARQLDGE